MKNLTVVSGTKILVSETGGWLSGDWLASYCSLLVSSKIIGDSVKKKRKAEKRKEKEGRKVGA